MAMADVGSYMQYTNAIRNALAQLETAEHPDSAYDAVWAKLKAVKRG